MKKSDLKTGMWIECPDGYKACVMLGTAFGDIATNGITYLELKNIKEDLMHEWTKSCNIEKVFDPIYENDCMSGKRIKEIWKREPEPIEMTLEEACKKLRETVGRPVKITV